jgi:hypothetical protein
MILRSTHLSFGVNFLGDSLFYIIHQDINEYLNIMFYNMFCVKLNVIDNYFITSITIEPETIICHV